jgi:hypothetical protein
VGRKASPLTVEQILTWADAHHARTGHWPQSGSGLIPEAPGVKWAAVNSALGDGLRGLPGGDSLSRLLDRLRRPGARRPPPWTPEEDEMVRTLSAREAARRTGRSLGAVYARLTRLAGPA